MSLRSRCTALWVVFYSCTYCYKRRIFVKRSPNFMTLSCSIDADLVVSRAGVIPLGTHRDPSMLCRNSFFSNAKSKSDACEHAVSSLICNGVCYSQRSLFLSCSGIVRHCFCNPWPIICRKSNVISGSGQRPKKQNATTMEAVKTHFTISQVVEQLSTKNSNTNVYEFSVN